MLCTLVSLACVVVHSGRLRVVSVTGAADVLTDCVEEELTACDCDVVADLIGSLTSSRDDDNSPVTDANVVSVDDGINTSCV